jgi:hypothetical protein
MNEDLGAIGELIRYGLDPRFPPGRDPNYMDLVMRFRTNADFRRQAEAVTAGQGLDVLDCSPINGLVLVAADAESPYHMPLDEYAAMKAEERHLHAFVFLAIAAACYPTAEALEDEDGRLPSLTVSEVLRLMRTMAERIRTQQVKEVDPPADQPQLEPLYRLVLRWREGDTTGDERSNPHVLSGMVRKALTWMTRNGFADEIPTSKGAYRIRSRFRLHVKDAAYQVGAALADVRRLVAAGGPS